MPLEHFAPIPQQEHTEILHGLRFTLVFVQNVLEIATLKGSASEAAGGPEYQLQESMVADQISLLSREWGWVCPVGRWPGDMGPPSHLTCLLPSSFAEQLVLYLKVAELLSSGLQTAIDQIRAGKLCLSSTVKQGECGLHGALAAWKSGTRPGRVADYGERLCWGLLERQRWGQGRASPGSAELTPTVVRKLNELYKASVLSCQGLSLRLQRFFVDKQRLLDRIQSVTAEKLIFSHAVHTVQLGAGGGRWGCRSWGGKDTTQPPS